MMKRQYTIYNICVLLALLFLGGTWNMAWGQQYGDTRTVESTPVSLWPGNSGDGKSIVNTTDATALGGDREIVYAAAGESKRLSIQDGGSADNLDGYIRWYVVDSEDNITNIDVQHVGDLQNPYITADSNMAYGKILQFSNGIAWLRGTHSVLHQTYNGWYQGWQTTRTDTGVDDIAPGEICSIFYNVPSNFSSSDEIVVVCEASSLNNVEGESNDTQWTAPMVTFRHVFVIRHASERSNTLSSRRTNLEQSYDGWEAGGQTFLNLVAADKSNLFLESYEIHTPLTQGNDSNGNALIEDEIGTNYRIAEDMTIVSNNTVYSGNYWVSDSQEANRVVWRVFNANGVLQQLEADNGGFSNSYVVAHSNIWAKAFGTTQGIDINSNQTQVLYLVATVKRGDSGIEYPVGFFTVYLEPYTEPLTQKELNSKVTSDANHYSIRTTTHLEANNYKQIASLQFEADDTAVPNLDVSNNFAESPDVMRDADSYYAYAYPSEFSYRKNNRLSVGRGEYGLYRSLNYSGISKDEVQINGVEGVYNDFFASQGGVYNKYIFDRTFDQTGSYGFFLYLDATDDPGVITTIDLPNDLCSDTRLIVTAWVCDMAHRRTETHADIGLTFIGVNGDTETILNRFYSGKIMNKPSNWGSASAYEKADWQQVYFNFTFQDLGYDSYRLEISNNAPNSDGADYAIDDIRVWRSTPNIQVNRREACDASSLLITTDYNTLLNNMDWTEGEEISDIQQVANNPDLLKYRLGLRGDAEDATNYPQAEMKVGNTYFSFLEGLVEDASGNWIASGDDVTDTNPDGILGENDYRWVRINKNLPAETAPEQSIYSLRVVVATDARTQTNYPKSEVAALQAERILNLRAVKDYNYLIDDTNWNNLWSGTNPVPSKPTWLSGQQKIGLGNLTERNVNDAANESAYLSVIQELYSRLQIPRIHCPWLDATNDDLLHLCPVDVDDTDLRYEGEIIGRNNDGSSIKASGDYQVILFGAIEVNGWNDGSSSGPNLNDPCNLISAFSVTRSVRIRVDTDPDTEGLICAGTQRQITAELLNKYTGEPLEKGSFGFDWFLGTQVEYNALTMAGTFGASSNGTNYTLKDAINEYRDDMNDTDSFDRDAVEAWQASNATMKEGLLSLFDNENGRVWLLTDKSESFTIVLDSESIVAMPFIKTQVDGTLYCTEITEVPFDDYSEKVPEIHPGVPGVEYPTELANVPLRLGLRHIANGKSLTIPLQKDIKFAVENTIGHSLIRNPNNTNVSLYVNNMPTVATLQSLTVEQGSEENSLTLTFNDNYTFAEGQEYILLIPFSESEDGSTVLGTTCDGLARLPIKIVPEYLTWQSGGTNWYNEGSETTNAAWKQSTEKELYMGDERIDQDANGSDDINDIYSPLYFTKITIPSSTELALVEATTDGYGTSTVKGIGDIQYDMAVDTLKSDDEGYIVEGSNITVRPYYINKVSEIYFKPEATLMNQHYLEYDTARVEFTMERNKAYWMASPLHGVYAGDMYAPYEKGIQNTPAFQYILFDYGDNSPYHRWELPFYQKAWNKEVAYSKIVDPYTGTPNAGDIISVDAVKSNWSIEYNDVWVPYTIGKGFYMRVDEKEGDAVTVRLPKADSDYIYQATKAGLSEKGDRANAGRLAITLNDGIVEVDLKKVYGETASDVGESEARHFLVGNPYMTYLNMAKFLEVNSKVLNSKYWTLANGAPSAVVGTPDVEFSGENGTLGSVSRTVKPMEAFFIEVIAGTEDTKVTFTPEMMSSSEITATAETRSYSATNPTLTITAERGETKSVAKLVTSDTADNGYEASEDAVVLLDSELDAPMVYTVSGSRAAQVNAMKEISNVGLGIYNENDDEATVTISGLSQMASPLYLYDAQTRKSVELSGDSYTMQITGDSHGRYYLRNSAMADELENTISIYSAQRGQVIVSALQPVREIKVFNVSGALVRQFSVNTTQYTFPIQSGLYIIYASDGEQEQTEKVIVR